jgi:hypothetical protein
MAISSKIARGTAAKITARKEATAAANTVKMNRQEALKNAANKTPIQMKNVGKEVLSKSKALGTVKERLAAKKVAKSTPAPATKSAPVSTTAAATPAMQKKKMVSKKTAYDIKEASNPKLKANARKNYAMNAEASMKNQKKK